MRTERPAPSILPLFRPKRAQRLQAALFFAALLVWLFREAWPLLHSHYISGVSADAGLYVWLAKTIHHNLSLPWYNTAAFYPYGLSLAWSDNFILPSLVVSGLHAFGFSYLLAFNLLILCCYFLAGVCTWEVSFKLTGSQLASLIAATAFCANGFLLYHLGHPQLQFTFFLPLTISLSLELISRADAKAALLLGLNIFFSFLCAVYYAVFCLLLAACLLASAAFLRPGVWTKDQLTKVTAAFCAGLLPLIPFALPYLEAKGAFGGRALYEAYYFSADLLSYFSASPLNLLYGFSSSLSHAEAHLFPGFCVILAAMAALNSLGGTKKLDKPFIYFIAAFLLCLLSSTQVKLNGVKYICAITLWVSLFLFIDLARRIRGLERELAFNPFSNRAVLSALFFCALVFFALSLGPLANPEKGQYPLGVFALTHFLLPGMDAMRAASRAGVVVILLLSVASAFSIKKFLAKRAKYRIALGALLITAILLENYTVHLPLEADPSPPALLADLQSAAAPGDVAIFLPLAGNLKADGQVSSWRDFAIRNVRAMNWSARLSISVVNGYSGQRSKLMREFPARLRNFPDEQSLRTLEQIVGLRFIVADLQSLKLDTANLPAGLHLIREDSARFALLEFKPVTAINQSLTLLAPAFAPGALELEFMNFDTGNSGPIPIDLYLDSQPFFAVDLAPDKSTEIFRISLPAADDKIRPARITFKLPAQARVALGKRGFFLEK